MRKTQGRKDDFAEQALSELIRTSELVKGFRKRSYAIFSLSGFTDRLIEIAKEKEVFLADMDVIYRGRIGRLRDDA